MPVSEILPFRDVPILLYHRIGPTVPRTRPAGIAVSPECFEAQLRFLRARRFRIVDLDTALAMKSGEIPLERKCVSITFDDGYLDTFTEAFPLLLRYGAPATVFIVPGLMGKLSTWHACPPVRLLDWRHAREMMRYGIRFANHSHTHQNLTMLDDARVESEIENARRRIEDKLGISTTLLSYPYGAFTPELMKKVESLGYTHALAAHCSENSKFCRERFGVYTKDNLFNFYLKTWEWGSWLRRMAREKSLEFRGRAWNFRRQA